MSNLLKTIMIAVFLVVLAPLAIGASWTGYVLDNSSTGINATNITVINASNSIQLNSTLTNASGFFNISIPDNVSVKLFSTKSGYQNDTTQGLPPINTSTQLPFNITLITALPGNIQGHITNSSSNGINATVAVLLAGTTVTTTTTNASGYYLISNITDGTYDLTVTANGYLTQNHTNVVVQPNSTTTVNFTMAQGNSSVLAISSVSSTTTINTAEITWTTSSAANSTINYGTSTSLGTKASSSSFVTSHSSTLSGLTGNKLYFYNITSCDSSSNCATSGTHSFTTKKSGGGNNNGGDDDDDDNDNLFIPSTTQIVDFEDGSSFNLKMDFSDVIKISYKGIFHKVFVMKLNKDVVILQIRSIPQILNLTQGQSKEVDLTEDNITDIKLTLNKIIQKTRRFSTSYEADITFALLQEAAPVNVTDTTQNQTVSDDEQDEEEVDDYEESKLSEGVKILSRRMPFKTKVSFSIITLVILGLLYGIYRRGLEF